MHQAGKKMLLATVLALSSIFVLTQPRIVLASQINGQGEAGYRMVSGDAVADKYSSLSLKDRLVISSYIKGAKFTSYDEINELISTIEAPKDQTTKRIVQRYKATVRGLSQNQIKQDLTGSLNADQLFNLVNNYRNSIGLASLKKDDRVMGVASERAPELYSEIFVNANMHAGFYNRNLPYQATENIIFYNNEQGALSWWLHSYVHKKAIEGNYQYAGIACFCKACSMIFTNYQPR